MNGASVRAICAKAEKIMDKEKCVMLTTVTTLFPLGEKVGVSAQKRYEKE